MDEGISPTLRLWQLAEMMRELREQRGWTMEEAAKELKEASGKGWSRSKVQRIEHRLYVPKKPDVEQIAKAYELSEEQEAEMLQMAKEARQKGWWQSSALPANYHTMAGLERGATTIRDFQLAFVPGLLQSPAYVRALMTSIDPLTAPEVLEGRIAARLTRQHVLESKVPPQLHAIIAEPVLRWTVGGANVMRDQYQHLLAYMEKRDVTIQVLPYSVGANAGMEGSFTVLTLPQLANDVGYVEGMMGAVYLESRDDVRNCIIRFATLSDKALSPAQSIEFIRSMLGAKS